MCGRLLGRPKLLKRNSSAGRLAERSRFDAPAPDLPGPPSHSSTVAIVMHTVCQVSGEVREIFGTLVQMAGVAEVWCGVVVLSRINVCARRRCWHVKGSV